VVWMTTRKSTKYLPLCHGLSLRRVSVMAGILMLLSILYKCTNTESLSCLFVAPRTAWNGYDPGVQVAPA
jgi:hypothetical protein